MRRLNKMEITYEYFEEIDSTNDELKRRIDRDEVSDGHVISAGMQTGGRGRSGHTWSSPKGTSVSTSMVLMPEGIDTSYLPRITPMAAVAVASAIEELYGLKAFIKWPNDVLINDKKICGILNELIVKDGRAYVVVGIGVNVDVREFPEDIRDKATSLDQALEQAGMDKVTHCEDVVKSIWDRFVKYYLEFLKTKDLSFVLDFYNSRLINRGRMVRVADPIRPFEGEAAGIDVRGALHVITDDGEKIVDSGEVSVRGLHNEYVPG